MVKNGDECVYGFIDESGSSGVANGENDFLVVSVALFMGERKAAQVRENFSFLRQELNLSPNYEFHFSHNKPKIRAAVFATMAGMDFEFMTFAIKKNGIKRDASYMKMAQMIVKELGAKCDRRLKILIDVNPVFYNELNKAKKRCHVRNMNFRQGDSAENDGLQLVDYVVGGHSKIIKGERSFGFKKIAEKMAVLRAEEQNRDHPYERGDLA